MISLEQYGVKYGFAPPKLRGSNEIAYLRQRVESERFLERRRIFAGLLSGRLMIERLDCNIISLPIRPSKLTESYIVKDARLFIGGIERRLTSQYEDAQGYFNRTRYERIYIGDLPPLVVEKYIQAKQYFPIDKIVVISKDARLFDTTIINVPKMSPLLVAFGPDDTQYLLACWGLEHEIEKRYGGLLEDTE